jgi:hypothetical protein
MLNGIRDHINSFPRMDAHYTRADSNRQFLGSDLNISRMYDLYKEACGTAATQPVKLGVYRKVFCNEFNLSFHQPRKDVCSKCERYDNAGSDEKAAIEAEYKEHLERKDIARKEKMADKAKARSDASYHAITVDLQSVLTTPCSNASALYYSRKLAIYNFTVYSQATADGFCMLWNETDGQRGSNEIGTLLFIYLRDCLPPNVTHVVITSDSTVSQNRNRFVTAMMLLAVQVLPNIHTIEQKYLEPGHTEMEVDSMHAAIDSARKNLKVFAPSEWPMVLQMARRSKPYDVKEFEFSDFYDLHDLAKSLHADGLTRDVNNIPVSWMKIKCIRVKKGVSDEIEVKESYCEPFRRILLGSTAVRQTRKQAQLPKVNVDLSLLKPAYKRQLPISKLKKADLLKLCASGLILRKHHPFYNSLSTSDITDCLPQPDATENSSGDQDKQNE